MPAVPEMPNVQKLPVRDRVAAMAAWLRAYGEPLESDTTSDVRSAWRAVHRKLDKQTLRWEGDQRFAPRKDCAASPACLWPSPPR